jgi:hypothetical protein
MPSSPVWTGVLWDSRSSHNWPFLHLISHIYRLWNYNPDNTDSHGDYWNGENFSWFSTQGVKPSALRSLDQTNEELDDGGRVLRSLVRPYPAKVAGIPTRVDYSVNTGAFTCSWKTPTSGSSVAGSGSEKNPSVATPPLIGHPVITARETEIFMPHLLTKGRRLILKYVCNTDEQAECDWRHNSSLQTLYVVPEDSAPGSLHTLEITFDPPLEELFPSDSPIWREFSHIWIPVLIVFLSLLAVPFVW